MDAKGRSGTLLKRGRELAFWWSRRLREGRLENAQYEYFFTTTFGLDRQFFTGKRVLDVGCGPRGSLEWATNSLERVGLDPLVGQYRMLGIDRHAMSYVDAPAEQMPFPNGAFDVISCLNALDHVEDVEQTIREISRVAARAATLLLLTDVNHKPTITEPQTFSWEVIDLFDKWEPEEMKRYERDPVGVYESLRAAKLFDESNRTDRYGLLAARLRRT
jgi:ubiquinone/menaquinone biosynthesis C-methylase UbiE